MLCVEAHEDPTVHTIGLKGNVPGSPQRVSPPHGAIKQTEVFVVHECHDLVQDLRSPAVAREAVVDGDGVVPVVNGRQDPVTIHTDGEEHQLEQEDVVGAQPAVSHVRVAACREPGVEV